MLTDVQTICLTVGVVALYAIWRFRGFEYEKHLRIGVKAKPKKDEVENDSGV